jgi:SAM-dependent methyltransferase
MTYCIDIDGVLCNNTHGRYELAQPYKAVIARVNMLYELGHRVVLFTARGTITGIDWRDLTETQMRDWGVKYHQLFFGKPEADIYVDDRGMGPVTWQEIGLPAGPLETPVHQGSVLQDPEYLKVTYSPERAPKGSYPHLLAAWLLNNIYKKPGRLLDLGCGRGDHLEAFAALGFEVAGVDISSGAPELSQVGTVKVADLEQDPLPFSPSSFDFVFSKSVIEHLRHPARLLAKALEALKPGGVAVIMTPSWAHTYWGPFYIDHTHVTPFTAPSLLDAITIAGFESSEVIHFYQLPFLWRYPFLRPFSRLIAALPLPYRPYKPAPWPEGFNKLIRFSKEVMLLGVGRKTERQA